MGLSLEGYVGVHGQDGEKALQAEPHVALSWARWVEWFHFVQSWEDGMACPRRWGPDLLIPPLVLCLLPHLAAS